MTGFTSYYYTVLVESLILPFCFNFVYSLLMSFGLLCISKTVTISGPDTDNKIYQKFVIYIKVYTYKIPPRCRLTHLDNILVLYYNGIFLPLGLKRCHFLI